MSSDTRVLKRAKLQRTLADLDSMLEQMEAEQQLMPAQAEGGKQPKSSKNADINVTIGTSKMAEDPAMVKSIMQMVNQSYYESVKELLNPRQKSYERLSLDEVVDRLEMGDAGSRANRVLHIAYRGHELTPASLVGCMSSTYQPPWTERGCGHWGLLVVDKGCQGQGIASVLIEAAEMRLAGACHEIQIEYEFTPDHEYSERLMSWYEGKLGFKCSTGVRRGMGTQFRKCRKPIPPEVSGQAKIERIRAIRSEVAEELAGGDDKSHCGKADVSSEDDDAESASSEASPA